jgi:hypothetical protein
MTIENNFVLYCLLLPIGIILWTMAGAVLAFVIGALFGDHSKD